MLVRLVPVRNLTGLFFPNACMIVRSFLFFSTSKGATLGMALVMFVGHSPELTIHKRSNRTCTAYPGTIENKFENERLFNFLLRVRPSSNVDLYMYRT